MPVTNFLPLSSEFILFARSVIIELCLLYIFPLPVSRKLSSVSKDTEVSLEVEGVFLSASDVALIPGSWRMCFLEIST